MGAERRLGVSGGCSAACFPVASLGPVDKVRAMNFSFGSGDPARAKADVLVIPVFDNELNDKKKQAQAVASADKKLKGLLLKTAAQEGFKGKGEQSLVFH